MKGKKFITTICIVCVLAVLLCIPAFATVTESDGDGYALYNGVKLPDIDSVWSDKATYPYSFLVSRIGTTRTVLWLTSDPVVFNSSNQFRVETLGREYWFEAGSFGWEYKREVETGSSLGGSYYQLLWSNHDILKYDNTVYLAASSPVPLDGYDVIEWDGDTSGITDIIEINYRIADYSPATSGIAVFSVNGLRYVSTDFIINDPAWIIQGGSYSVGNATYTPSVVGGNGDYFGIDLNGIYAPYLASGSNIVYSPLIAYRSTETPPDEGGGDDDDPQPPAGG